MLSLLSQGILVEYVKRWDIGVLDQVQHSHIKNDKSKGHRDKMTCPRLQKHYFIPGTGKAEENKLSSSRNYRNNILLDRLNRWEYWIF